MAGAHQISPSNVLHRPIRISRHKTASTKLTEAEYAQVEQLAENRGQWLSEWVRDVLLAAIREQRSPQSIAAFTEVISFVLLVVK